MRPPTVPVLCALLLLLVALGPAACTPVREPDLVLWHSWRGEEAESLHASVRAWEAAHPGVRVEVVPVPYGAFANKLSAALPRGHGPDLFIAAHERTGAWARRGWISPVDLADAQGPGADMPALLQQALTVEGAVYGVPLAFKSVGLLYRRSALAAWGEEPPTTTDDLQALALRWVAEGSRRHGLVYQNGDFYFHAGWLHGFGGSLSGPDGGPVLPPDALEASFAFARTLRRTPGLVPPDSDYPLVKQALGQGDALFAIAGPWLLAELGAGAADIGVAPLPVVSATGLPARPLVTVDAAYVSARDGGPRLARAHALSLWLAGEASSELRATLGGQLVSRRSVLDRVSVSRPDLAGFVAAADAGVPMPNEPSFALLWDPATRALSRVLRGERTPQEAAAQAARELEGLVTAPPMRPASPAPWLVLVSLLGLVAAGWSVRQARRDDLLARMWTAREAYAWVAPAAAATLALLVVPFVLGALISLYAHEEGTFTFAGLQNFLRILSARDSGFWAPRSFWYTLVITVVWTGLNVALHVAVGLGLALILREPWVRLRGMWRTLLIIPWAVPNYITALTWRGLFNFNYGAVNNLLAWLGVERVDWFSNFATSFAANLVTNTWLGFPFMMVVCLGALQAIPRDLEDAAEVDGATGWQRFRHVTWPLLQPALVPAMVLGTVWTFNMFNVIYLVSEGGPDSRTEILITEAYRWAFQRNEQYGLAAAYGVLIFGVLWVWGRFSGRWGQGPGTPGGRGGKP